MYVLLYIAMSVCLRRAQLAMAGTMVIELIANRGQWSQKLVITHHSVAALAKRLMSVDWMPSWSWPTSRWWNDYHEAADADDENWDVNDGCDRSIPMNYWRSHQHPFRIVDETWAFEWSWICLRTIIFCIESTVPRLYRCCKDNPGIPYRAEKITTENLLQFRL